MSTTITTHDKCPNCGANECTGVAIQDFECGSILGAFNSTLCAERAARQKAEAELEKWKGEFTRCSNSVVNAMVAFPNVSEYVTQLENQRDEARRELEETRRKLEEAEKRVGELEALEIGNECTSNGGVWLEVFVRESRMFRNAIESGEITTLGKAFPPKEGGAS